MTLKERIARIALVWSRFAMRYLAPSYGVRKAIWQTVIGPHLAWRRFTVEAEDAYGAKFKLITNDSIQRAIYLFGIWEPHVAAVIRNTLEPGDTFIDVGANIGYFSVTASRLVGPTGHVVSIEASSAVFERLRDSLDRNHCNNTRAIRGAVSNQKAPLKLFLPDPAEDNCGLGSIIRETAHFEESPGDKLGNWLTPDEISSARLIKIDVEGAEAFVIQGLAEILPAMRDDVEILAEITPDLGGADEVFDLLAKAGFRAFALPADTLDGYFHSSVKISMKEVTKLDRRTDVLFSRR